MANYYREVIALLTAHGCWKVRAGKGAHEIWRSPITEKQFVVTHNLNVRHTANAILKEDGIDEKV